MLRVGQPSVPEYHALIGQQAQLSGEVFARGLSAESARRKVRSNHAMAGHRRGEGVGPQSLSHGTG